MHVQESAQCVSRGLIECTLAKPAWQSKFMPALWVLCRGAQLQLALLHYFSRNYDDAWIELGIWLEQQAALSAGSAYQAAAQTPPASDMTTAPGPCSGIPSVPQHGAASPVQATLPVAPTPGASLPGDEVPHEGGQAVESTASYGCESPNVDDESAARSSGHITQADTVPEAMVSAIGDAQLPSTTSTQQQCQDGDPAQGIEAKPGGDDHQEGAQEVGHQQEAAAEVLPDLVKAQMLLEKIRLQLDFVTPRQSS